MDRLISLQAAIDAFKKELTVGKLDGKYVTLCSAVGYEGAKQILESLPSAQPEPQWIPCSKTEDLPKHEVLCCDKYGEELIGWLSYSDDQWLCESDCEMMYDPIAWREKPEPWEGEEHETD